MKRVLFTGIFLWMIQCHGVVNDYPVESLPIVQVLNNSDLASYIYSYIDDPSFESQSCFTQMNKATWVLFPTLFHQVKTRARTCENELLKIYHFLKYASFEGIFKYKTANRYFARVSNILHNCEVLLKDRNEHFNAYSQILPFYTTKINDVCSNLFHFCEISLASFIEDSSATDFTFQTNKQFIQCSFKIIEDYQQLTTIKKFFNFFERKTLEYIKEFYTFQFPLFFTSNYSDLYFFKGNFVQKSPEPGKIENSLKQAVQILGIPAQILTRFEKITQRINDLKADPEKVKHIWAQELKNKIYSLKNLTEANHFQNTITECYRKYNFPNPFITQQNYYFFIMLSQKYSQDIAQLSCRVSDNAALSPAYFNMLSYKNSLQNLMQNISGLMNESNSYCLKFIKKLQDKINILEFAQNSYMENRNHFLKDSTLDLPSMEEIAHAVGQWFEERAQSNLFPTLEELQLEWGLYTSPIFLKNPNPEEPVLKRIRLGTA